MRPESLRSHTAMRFALDVVAVASSAEAIDIQAPNAPGYAARDTLFPFGFG